MKLYFIITVLTVVSIKCANEKGLQKEMSIEGSYIYRKKSIEDTVHNFILTRNHKFEYLHREGLAEYKAKGSYPVTEDNLLILNSNTSVISKKTEL